MRISRYAPEHAESVERMTFPSLIGTFSDCVALIEDGRARNAEVRNEVFYVRFDQDSRGKTKIGELV
jgi:hypothetical protein